MHLRSWLLTSAFLAAAFVGAAARADVTGKVKLDGKAPEPKEIDMKAVAECAKLHSDPVYDETVVAAEDGSLANVVVFIKTDDPSSLGGEIPKEPAVIDQNGCTYVPHVLAMMVGQEMQVKNSDPFLHNVHSLAQQNPAFNFGQPNVDPGKKVDPPKTAEQIKVKCDVHPWMGMWIIVLDHPFFAVSKEDGTFAIKGLPEGDYQVQAWHEKYGTQDGTVKVDGSGNGTVDFTFKDSGAMAPQQGAEADVRLASLQRESGTAGCCAGKSDPKLASAGDEEPVGK